MACSRETVVSFKVHVLSGLLFGMYKVKFLEKKIYGLNFQNFTLTL